MSTIEVDPDVLVAAARHLRAANAAARQVHRSAAAASPAVTGSSELSAALAGHAEAWGWTIEAIEDRVREASAALESGGLTYDWVEQCVTASAGGA